MVTAYTLYFVGSAQGSHDDTHIKADLLREWIRSERVKWRLGCLIVGIEILICGVLAYWGYLMVADDLSRYPDLPATPVYSIPLAVPRGVIFLGFVLMTAYSVMHLVRLLASPPGNDATRPGRREIRHDAARCPVAALRCADHRPSRSDRLRSDHDVSRRVRRRGPHGLPQRRLLAHEQHRPACDPAVHHGGRDHGEGTDRRPHGTTGGALRRPGSGRAVGRGSRGKRHLRLDLGQCGRNAHLHRFRAAAPTACGQLPGRLFGCADRQRGAAWPAHPAQFDPDHLCLGDAAVRAQVLSRHGSPRADPHYPALPAEPCADGEVQEHQGGAAATELSRRAGKPQYSTPSRHCSCRSSSWAASTAAS